MKKTLKAHLHFIHSFGQTTKSCLLTNFDICKKLSNNNKYLIVCKLFCIITACKLDFTATYLMYIRPYTAKNWKV